MSLAGMGHNKGPTMEPGHGWRAHCWKAARKSLMPRLPIEVLRRRLARAQEIGLDYSTYATFREAGGRDIIAILFSSNALHLLRKTDSLPSRQAAKLACVTRCGRILLARPSLDPLALADRINAESGRVLDGAADAPDYPPSWSGMRCRVQGALSRFGHNRRGVILVGETGFEREWSMAGGLAGYLAAERYFAKEGAKNAS